MRSKLKYCSKIVRTLKKEGVYSLFRKIINHLTLRIMPYFDFRFDKKFGVDTCGTMFQGDESDIGFAEKKTAVRYEATPVNAARSILKNLTIDHSAYTFIDFGSGKGRVLLLASEYPYKNIIGMELSQRLNEICQKNIEVWNSPEQKCFNIKSFCTNAAVFKLPNEPLILFFFTPFSASLMSNVISNIQESLKNAPRSLHIVYYGSRQDLIELFFKLGFSHQEIYSKRPLSASGEYKAHLFSCDGGCQNNHALPK